jgi:hypothetical protein
MPDIQAMTKQLSDQLKRESESLKLWNSFEPITVTDQRRKSFNVRSEMITRCKLNIRAAAGRVARMSQRVRPEVAGPMKSSAICGYEGEGLHRPGCRFAHPGYILITPDNPLPP